MRLRCHHRKETLNWGQAGHRRRADPLPGGGRRRSRLLRLPELPELPLRRVRKSSSRLIARSIQTGEEEARAAFSAESLAAAINEICNYVRK